MARFPGLKIRMKVVICDTATAKSEGRLSICRRLANPGFDVPG
jgi:hypothetical protein